MNSKFIEIKGKDFLETDKYGHKAMLKAVNEQYRCPECQTFLVWKDEKNNLAECPNCNFEKKVGEEQ